MRHITTPPRRLTDIIAPAGSVMDGDLDEIIDALANRRPTSN